MHNNDIDNSYSNKLRQEFSYPSKPKQQWSHRERDELDTSTHSIGGSRYPKSIQQLARESEDRPDPYISKKIQWDAEYTRLIIEKIIEATVIEYDKTKSKDE
jgi:hypothetical protein